MKTQVITTLFWISGTLLSNAQQVIIDNIIAGANAGHWQGFKSTGPTGLWGFQQNELMFLGVGGNVYNRGFSTNAMGIFNGSVTKEDIYLYNQNAPAADFLVLKTSGNVGIGVANPSARLELPNRGNGTLRVGINSNMANTHSQFINSLAVLGDDSYTTASNLVGAWNFYNNGSSPSWSGALLQHVGTSVTGTEFGLPAANMGRVLFQNVANGVIASNGANIYISPQGTLSASFLTNGDVGIGTSDTKGYKLAVNGSAIFTKAVVKLYGSWPDYVFTPGYKLRSLRDVEQFIKLYQHLPEVPTAKEVEEKGVNVGENQAVLLKKIEELTMYLIEHDKTIDLLKRENENNLREIKVLKEQLKLVTELSREVEQLRKILKCSL